MRVCHGARWRRPWRRLWECAGLDRESSRPGGVDGDFDVGSMLLLPTLEGGEGATLMVLSWK